MMLSTADKVLQALQAFGIKEEGKGKYRLNSPLRPGSNSHAFTVTIDDGEHGAYHDFVSGDHGSLYDLAKALNIEIERVQVDDTKRKYRDLLDYANAHGIGADVLIKAGWKQVVKDNRPALLFKTATGDRWRFLDGEKPVYKSSPGYKKCWYGVQRALANHDKDQPLIICNGEISTVVAQHYGMAAMCVTSGEGKLPDDLLRELISKIWVTPGETQILVALDCDVKGRMAAMQIQSQLVLVGFTQARAVDLMLGDKGDLADFCKLHEDKAAAAIIALPSLVTKDDDDAFDDEDFEIIDITQFRDLPPVEWIIDGEIPKRGFVTIFGESNVGKSFIALDYALRIARNELVLYVALEGESGIPLRVFGWCKHHHVHPENLKFKMLVGYVSFFDGEDMKRFIDAINPLKPYLIVVDTFGLVMGSGDENSAGHVNMVMKATRRIQNKLGCTIIFIHHTNKGGVQERGSGALRGRMDTMIQVLPDDDLIRVENSKSRDTKTFVPKSIKLLPVQVDDMGETLVPIDAAQYVRDEDAITPDQHKILTVLAMSANREGLPQRELAELARITYGRTVRALSNLVDKELIDPPKKRGQHHRVNNDGRKAIGLTPIDDDKDDEEDDGSQTGLGSPAKKAA
ncbi:MAG: AAA family ATPase [Chloroflexi bacterium]|uniref:AAA family ATPase n=1 Tax=Candidatus Flexifilum breve TaxID=3140694 RepID=UPI003134CB29|nr:AAA family ATPase [Chloroflexota bacterium]